MDFTKMLCNGQASRHKNRFLLSSQTADTDTIYADFLHTAL